MSRLIQTEDRITTDVLDAVRAIRPMVEAYRKWATGLMTASDFGAIADPAIIAYDRTSGGWG